MGISYTSPSNKNYIQFYSKSIDIWYPFGKTIVSDSNTCFTYIAFNKYGNLISTNGNNGELLIYAYNSMNNQWMINTTHNDKKNITHINHNSGYILSKLMSVNNFQNINVSFTDDSKYLISHNYSFGNLPYSENYTLMNNPIHNENGVYPDGTNQFIKNGTI